MTNIVGVCLTLLYYLSNLEKISLNLILVVFSVAMLLFANMMIMFASVKKRQQFLIPWLVITPIAILAAIIYCSLQWDQLTEFRVIRTYLVVTCNKQISDLIASKTKGR